MRPEVNLLPKYERYSNLTYIIFMIGMIIFLLLAGLMTYLFVTEENALETEEREISQLTQQKTTLENRLSENLESQTTTLSDAVLFAESHAIPVSRLVDEFFKLLPENGHLVNYEYDYYTVTIDSHFETMTDTANYMELLTNSRYLTDARVDYIDTADPEYQSVEGEEEERETEVDYTIVPRYQATYSLDVNQQALMEEEEDE